MEQYLQDFYKAFNIERQVADYWIASYSGFPRIMTNTILELEEMLIDMNKDCHIELYKEYLPDVNKRIYHYVIIQNDYNNPDENYSHMFCNELAYTRKEALIRFLTHYAHVAYIYENVRNVLKV